MLTIARTTAAVCAAIGFLAAAAPLHAPKTAAEWDTVIAEAKKEGKVVVYSAFIGSPQPPMVAALFEKKYGIKVEILDGRPSEINERIRSEASANRQVADINLNGTPPVQLLRDAGLIQQFPPIPNAKNNIIESNKDELPIFVNAYGILVNSKLVPPDQQPKSWQDLLDPKWKGKILADQMNATGAGATWFAVMQEAFGTEFHEKFAKQEIVFSRIIKEIPRRVARGEFSIYVPLIVADMGSNEGLPLTPIVPKEGLVYTPFVLALLKNAPHPNAARLFMNFYLEPEAQLIYAQSGYPTAISGLTDQVPEKWKWAATAKLMGRAKIEGQQERLTLAEKIYGK